MFKVFANKGFQITFKNGWTVSVMYGEGNYCERQYNTPKQMPASPFTAHESPTAEIAAWDKDDKWLRFESDEVKGYVSADEVANFIQLIKNK